MVHKTCICLPNDFEKTEKWFCDVCNEFQKQVPIKLNKEDLLEKTSWSDFRNLNGGLEEPIHYNQETDKTYDGISDRSKKLKKRKKNKYYNEKKQTTKINSHPKKETHENGFVKNEQDNKLEYKSEHLNDLICYFCKLPYGPMMKLAKPENQWGHLSCSYWLPCVGPYIPERLIYISTKGYKKLEFKGNESCAYCHSKDGLFAKCFQKECKTYFHVECGRRMFCELKFPYQLKVKQKHHAIFCVEHSQSFDFRKIEQNLSSDKTQMKNILKNFSNHHNYAMHFDFKVAFRKLKLKKIVICLKKVSGKRPESGYHYLETLFE